MKILVSAFTCWPCESSEPGVAWRFISHWLKNHEVWLLTQSAPGPLKRINEFVSKNSIDNLHLIHFPGFSPDLETLEPYVNLYYPIWQRNIIHLAKKLHKEQKFDFVHHVTFSRYYEGSSLVKLGIPFVWGPLGAGENPPHHLLKGLPWKFQTKCGVRRFAQSLMERSPFLRSTAKKSTISFATTKDTLDRIKKLGAQNSFLFPQITFSRSRINELRAFSSLPGNACLRLISVGRLVYWKGFHFGLYVVSELLKRGISVKYSIVNNGPMMSFLQNLAQELQISESVIFHGKIESYEEVLRMIGRSHFLIHPAIHEAFGNVCLESLAIGKPVVCLNIGGPATQVTKECGFAAPITNNNDMIQSIADFLEKSSKDNEFYLNLSRNSYQRVQKHFSIESLMPDFEKMVVQSIT
jgi:glycosyltransferase involved in cell wall biosynthesis